MPTHKHTHPRNLICMAFQFVLLWRSFRFVCLLAFPLCCICHCINFWYLRQFHSKLSAAHSRLFLMHPGQARPGPIPSHTNRTGARQVEAIWPGQGSLLLAGSGGVPGNYRHHKLNFSVPVFLIFPSLLCTGQRRDLSFIWLYALRASRTRVDVTPEMPDIGFHFILNLLRKIINPRKCIIHPLGIPFFANFGSLYYLQCAVWTLCCQTLGAGHSGELQCEEPGIFGGRAAGLVVGRPTRSPRKCAQDLWLRLLVVLVGCRAIKYNQIDCLFYRMYVCSGVGSQ